MRVLISAIVVAAGLGLAASAEAAPAQGNPVGGVAAAPIVNAQYHAERRMMRHRMERRMMRHHMERRMMRRHMMHRAMRHGY